MGNGTCITTKLKILELEVLNMKFKLIILLFLGVLMLSFDNALDLTENVEPPPIDKTALALSAI